MQKQTKIPLKVRKTFYLLCMGIVLLLVSPGAASAQEKEVISAKTKKASRVFYGLASFYSNKFNGRITASGEIFSQSKFTCACNVLPLGTWVKVTNLRNGKWALVKVNDRIHPKMRRVVDLSRAAAQKLGFVAHGLTRVKVEVSGKKPS